MAKVSTPRVPKPPKAPKVPKVAKKWLDNLEKFELRRIALLGMQLPEEQGYKMSVADLTAWVVENQERFVDLDVAQCGEHEFRPGVGGYIRDIVAFMRGERMAPEWPPIGIEMPTEEVEVPSSDDVLSSIDEDEDEEVYDEDDDIPLSQAYNLAEASSDVPADNPPEEEPKMTEAIKPARPALAFRAPAAKPLTAKPAEVKEPDPIDPPDMPIAPAPTTSAATASGGVSTLGLLEQVLTRLETLDKAMQVLSEDLNGLSHSVGVMEGGIAEQIKALNKQGSAPTAEKAKQAALQSDVTGISQKLNHTANAVLHLINTVRPWGEEHVFKSIEEVPGLEMYDEPADGTEAEADPA